MSERPLLKQFGDLSPEDFQQHPVWIHVHVVDYGEPWYAEANEETFRPRLGPLPASPGEGILLVRSRFTLADGRAFTGFITPEHAEPDELTPWMTGLGIIQPQMFLPSGLRLPFWFGVLKPDPDQLKSVYDELRAPPDRIFPIEFSADPALAEGIVSGRVDGFYRKNWRGKVVIIR